MEGLRLAGGAAAVISTVPISQSLGLSVACDIRACCLNRSTALGIICGVQRHIVSVSF